MISEKPILIFSDLHFPAACFKSINKVFSLIETVNFQHVVMLGDLYDQHAQSRFPKNPNLMTPQQETEKSRIMAEQFWEKNNRLFPKAKKWLLAGNHDAIRVQKKILSCAPETYHLLDVKKYWNFDGVETLHDYRDHLEINKINFIHGFSSKPGAHMSYFQSDVIFAHSHHSYISNMSIRNKTITEMCCGHLADPFHPFLSYTPLKKISKWTKAFAMVDHLGPRVIPL